MSDPGRSISEDDLHAYVDGLLNPERRAAVDAYLRTHTEVADRIAIDQAHRNALRAVFRSRAAEPPPSQLDPMRLVEERLMRRRLPWRAAAGFVLALGLGAGSGWWFAARSASGIGALAQDAVVSYKVYAVDKNRPVEIWAEHRDLLTRWLSNRLNRPVFPPDLDAVGYHLLGGRLAAGPRGAAALFMYQKADGRRLMLYVSPMSKTDETTSMNPVDLGKIDGCAWIDRGIGYSLIAHDEDYAQLLELSHYVRQAVASGR